MGWKTPGWTSAESNFVSLIAESAKDFAEFLEKTFPVAGEGKRAYAIRKVNINGSEWFIANDPVVDGSVRGIKVNEEIEKIVKELNHAGRIKVREG